MVILLRRWGYRLRRRRWCWCWCLDGGAGFITLRVRRWNRVRGRLALPLRPPGHAISHGKHREHHKQSHTISPQRLIAELVFDKEAPPGQFFAQPV